MFILFNQLIFQIATLVP